ncbi:flippase [Waterburya agarophytonicola K14]|uniref:Flippase n=1 Tax=Waterburya agarophytonicola KI4 TaxID=2874699 RepID=A0A964FF65_9CYAN|nr:flippase [Waterburya agarophytonicola]MCC0177430.1 flippase [Waterburya agarophytonicola KI4]
MFKAITKKIQLIWASQGQTNHLKNQLIKGVAGSLGLKVASAFLAFVMSVIFARFLGTSGLGTYSYATTWANLLSIPAALGLDQLIVREIAIYRNKAQYDLIGGFLRWANLMVLSAGITITLIAIIAAWNLKGDSDSTVVLAIALSMVAVPIMSLRNLRLGAMKGLRKIVLGQMPDSLFSPIIVIALTVATYFLFNDRFNVFWVLGIKIFASIVTLIIGTRWLLQSLPPEVSQVTPKYNTKKWIADGLPFMFLGASQLLNSRIDIIMLGSIKGVEAVGIYAVLLGITRLTVFIHHAANSVLGPNIATLYSEGKIRQLERIVRKSMLSVFLFSLVTGGLLMLLGNQVLLIFGSEFLPGRTAMNILIIGTIFTSFTGAVGLLLNMTGHQNETAIAVGLSAILNIILNSVLIPRWGINGAATATTTSLIVINIIKAISVKKKLGISLYSFGSPKTKNK